MHARAILFAVLVSTAGGCYSTAGYGYGYTTTGYVAPDVQAQVDVAPVQAQVDVQAPVDTGPELAAINPDVQVIVDHEEPIFFSDGYYWRETNGSWYRSTVWNGGWSYYAAPPYALRSLDRRDSYRRYRPANYVSRRGYDRGYTRDNRSYDRRGYTTRDNRSYDRGGYQRSGYTRDNRSGYTRDNRSGYTRDNRSGYTRDNRRSTTNRSYSRDHRGSYRRR